MAKNWQQGPRHAPLQRLGALVLRMQRVALHQRVEQLEALVQTHTSDLRHQPGGAKALADIRARLCEAKQTLLKEVPHGNR